MPVIKFIFKCVWAHYYSPCAAPAICLITFQSPFLSGRHTAHTSYLFIVCMASSLLTLPILTPSSSLILYITPDFQSLFLSPPPHHYPLSFLRICILAYLSTFFSLSFFFFFFCLPSVWLKIVPSPSGKKSGCIRVMRKFKSLKEDCTVECTKLIFHSVNVCHCMCKCLFQCACICISLWYVCLYLHLLWLSLLFVFLL